MQEADYTKGLQIDQRVGDELMLPREHIFKKKTPSVFLLVVFILMMRKLTIER